MSVQQLFFPRLRNDATKKEARLYLRFRKKGYPDVAIPLDKYVLPELWDSIGHCVMGKSEEAKEVNKYLSFKKVEISTHERRLMELGKTITPQSLRDSMNGADKPAENVSVLTAMDRYISDFKKLLDIGEVEQSTYSRHLRTRGYMADFLKHKNYSIGTLIVDMDIQYPMFQKDFEMYLKTEQSLSISSTNNILKVWRKIMEWCVSQRWLVRNPFDDFVWKHEEPDIVPLDLDELHRLMEVDVEAFPRLDRVRDNFIASCYTGMSYTDLDRSNEKMLIKDIDGSQWIQFHRKKTNILSSIPVLPPVERILEKYKDAPDRDGKLMPVISNAKTNAYLKELADLAKIKKNLTFHMARHTFATTICAENGIPMEIAAAMLGHNDLKTTQIYYKISKRKIRNATTELHSQTSFPKVIELKTS